MIRNQLIKIVKITREGREIISAAPAYRLGDVIAAVEKKNKESKPIGYDVLYSYILEDEVLVFEIDEKITL